MLTSHYLPMSYLRIQLFKAHPLIKSTPSFPPPQKKQYIEVWLDHFCAQLNNIDQGWLGGGVTVVANPWCRHPVGEKVPNSEHFFPKIAAPTHPPGLITRSG